MGRYDVLIIGGGPAGSTLARCLIGSGLTVAVMDKAEFPRQKVCAGWVTPTVIQELDMDVAGYAANNVLQPIHGFRVGQWGQPLVESRFPGEPVSYGIRRIEFDHYLLQRCGAELLLGQPFAAMERTEDGWRVNGGIEAGLVVGAGGHFCPVARAIGAKGTSEIAVAAQEIEFEMTPRQRAACVIDARMPELYFTPDLKGYGWVFRKDDYLNIGLGREDRSGLSGHVQRFAQYLKHQGRIPPDTPEKFDGHAYLLYPHARRAMVADNVLLIGDAAGLAYARSGEGIRPAVESAILAAGVIRDVGGDYNQSRLQAYTEKMEQRFGARRPAPGLMEQLPFGIKKLVAGRLMKTRWFTRNVVMERWFLHKEMGVVSLRDG